MPTENISMLVLRSYFI